MIDLEQVDWFLMALGEMLDPNATMDGEGETVVDAPNTTIGAGAPRGAGISGAQSTYYQGGGFGRGGPAAALGLHGANTTVGGGAPKGAGLSGAQYAYHEYGDFSTRMPPSVALGFDSDE